MTIEEYALQKDITQTEVFREAWEWVYGKPCMSNQVIIDSARYSAKRRIPQYMESFLQHLKRKPTMPDRAHRSLRQLLDSQSYRLVDDSPILQAHKDKRGIWVV